MTERQGSVVNLLDLREEESKGAGAGGNRWASRNPKAKAKSGGRNRRRNRPDGQEARKSSGFGGQRMNSQTSGLSEGSDYSDDPDQEAQQLQSVDPTRDAKPGSSSTELLRNDAEGQRVAHPLEVEENLTWGGEGVAEAKKIANLRALIRDTTPTVQGPYFKQNVWEYYMVKAGWSDPACAALNHSSMYVNCFLPCAWPIRLFQTVKRSATIPLKCCCKCQCPLNGCCAAPLILIIFGLPVLALLTFEPALSLMLEKQLESVDSLKGQTMLVSVGLTTLSILFLLFWWARILLGVGIKYGIPETLDKPNKFVAKTMACICSTNTRVGLHVDRAQGFEKVAKVDRTIIELSDQFCTPLSPPGQSEMV